MRKTKSIRKSRNNRTTRRRNRSTMKRTGGGLWDSIKNAFSSSDTPVETQVMSDEKFFPQPNEIGTVIPSTNTEAVVTGGRKKRRNRVRK